MLLLLAEGIVRLQHPADGAERAAVTVERAVEALLNRNSTKRGFVPIVADNTACVRQHFMVERMLNAANQQVATRMAQHKPVHH